MRSNDETMAILTKGLDDEEKAPDVVVETEGDSMPKSDMSAVEALGDKPDLVSGNEEDVETEEEKDDAIVFDFDQSTNPLRTEILRMKKEGLKSDSDVADFEEALSALGKLFAGKSAEKKPVKKDDGIDMEKYAASILGIK